MPRLREALKILLDEAVPIEVRLDILFPPKGTNFIKGLGKAIATPILLMAYPEKYGVWNAPSQLALESLNMLPRFPKGPSFANKYIQINEALNEIKETYNQSLWRVDAVLGQIAGRDIFHVTREENAELSEGEELVEAGNSTEFAFEKYLEDLILKHWSLTDVAHEYDLIEEDGDLLSQQYRTSVGTIDILAKSKDGEEWLVIELKKGATSDMVVGQTLRYMGWIKANLCDNNESVRGLIIAKDFDSKMQHAISMVDDISLMKYTVDFKLDTVERKLN